MTSEQHHGNRGETALSTHLGKQQANNPLHGITLEQIVNSLVEHFGWDKLGDTIDIRCFNNDPSVKSSLKFLRKTPWARKKVEDLYVSCFSPRRSGPRDPSGG